MSRKLGLPPRQAWRLVYIHPGQVDLSPARRIPHQFLGNKNIFWNSWKLVREKAGQYVMCYLPAGRRVICYVIINQHLRSPVILIISRTDLR